MNHRALNVCTSMPKRKDRQRKATPERTSSNTRRREQPPIHVSFTMDVGGVGGDTTPPWRVRRRHYQEAADRRRQAREVVAVSSASNTDNDSANDCDDGRDGDVDGDGTDDSELSTMGEPSGHAIVPLS